MRTRRSETNARTPGPRVSGRQPVPTLVVGFADWVVYVHVRVVLRRSVGITRARTNVSCSWTVQKRTDPRPDERRVSLINARHRGPPPFHVARSPGFRRKQKWLDNNLRVWTRIFPEAVSWVERKTKIVKTASICFSVTNYFLPNPSHRHSIRWRVRVFEWNAHEQCEYTYEYNFVLESIHAPDSNLAYEINALLLKHLIAFR